MLTLLCWAGENLRLKPHNLVLTCKLSGRVLATTRFEQHKLDLLELSKQAARLMVHPSILTWRCMTVELSEMPSGMTKAEAMWNEDLAADVVKEVYQPYVGWDVGARMCTQRVDHLRVPPRHTAILPELSVMRYDHLVIQGHEETNHNKQAINVFHALQVQCLRRIALKDMYLKASPTWSVALLQEFFLYRTKLTSLPRFPLSVRVLEFRETCLEGRDNQENILVGLCEQDLPNLINLVVFNCRQSGQIPVGISKFNKIVVLDLSRNLLSGTIPRTIGDLTNLELLNLSHNCLEGTIPTQLEKLTRLDQLVLAHNQLEGQVPLVYANRWFCLAHNKFCGVFSSKRGVQHTEGNLFDNQAELRQGRFCPCCE
jgi:hypothetical protein